MAEGRKITKYADLLPQIIFEADGDGVLHFLNQAYTALTGQDRDMATADQSWQKQVHVDDLPAILHLLVPADGSDQVQAEFRLRHADGAYRWMRLNARWQRASSRQDGSWYGVVADIDLEHSLRQELKAIGDGLQTRINRQAAELARTEARYSSLFAVSKIAFAEQDMAEAAEILNKLKSEGVRDLGAYMATHPDQLARCVAAVKTVSVNEACMRMLGFDDVDGAVDRPVDTTAEDIEAVLLRQFEMIFYDLDNVEGRVVLIGSQGRRVPVFYSVTRLSDERQLSSLVDISSQERVDEMQRAAQAELARANRVATVGAFSASIAHELNQPIVSVSMDANTGLRLLKRDNPDIEKAIRILDRVVVTIDRISAIVQHTHDQITSGQQALRKVDLVDLARKTCDLLHRDMRDAGFQLRVETDDAVPPVMGDFVDLQQVLINLINNARDSMAAEMADKHKLITIGVQATPHQVEVSVADVGMGIKDADIDRLFQPFFTTKQGGIGLGLQICISTIHRFGGDMKVTNLPEGGAKFSFWLPVAAQ